MNLEVGMTSSNLNCLTVDPGIKWTLDSDCALKIIFTKFQLSSTSGSKISRVLNSPVFYKKQCFPYKLESFPQIYTYVGKTNVLFYGKRRFSKWSKNSFVAPIDLKFSILA